MGLDLSGNGSSETMYDEGGSNTGELPAIKPEATAIFLICAANWRNHERNKS